MIRIRSVCLWSTRRWCEDLDTMRSAEVFWVLCDSLWNPHCELTNTPDAALTMGA